MSSCTEFGGDIDVGFKALNMDFMVDLKYRKQYNFQSEYTRVGFMDKKPIRKGPIKDIDGRDVGFITSSNKSFNLNKFIGMGYLKKALLEIPSELNCELNTNGISLLAICRD